ncbi:MAG: hypothetical protein ACKVOQ_08605 [Cyclobacteriaceae bacterium]
MATRGAVATGLSATSPSTHKTFTLRAFRYYPLPASATQHKVYQ